MNKRIYHTFDVYYNYDSEILILGSIPSVKSREKGFYFSLDNNSNIESVINDDINSFFNGNRNN